VKISRSTRGVAVAAALLALGLTAACSTPSSDVDGGSASTGKAADARDVADLNIGVFSTGSSNPYAKLLNDSIAARAEKAGAKATIIDSNFDVKKQLDQMQQALARKTYNAWIVIADDGVQECSQIKSAIKSGLPVMIAVGHVCGDDEIGQVGFVGVQTADAYGAWWTKMLDENSKASVAFFAGPPLVDLVQSMKKEMDAALKAHPNVDLVSYQNTDWTTATAFKQTQDLLKAHPDVQVIASSYSNSTRGIVQAVKQAGLEGKVKIYDMMGDQFIVDQIKAGAVTLTLPGQPASEGVSAVDNLVNAWTGKPTYKVFNPADDASVPDGPYITATNVEGYTAEIPSS
jgi:ribose transport system substrate-binding protein